MPSIVSPFADEPHGRTRALTALLACVSIAGCTVGPDFERPAANALAGSGGTPRASSGDGSGGGEAPWPRRHPVGERTG